MEAGRRYTAALCGLLLLRAVCLAARCHSGGSPAVWSTRARGEAFYKKFSLRGKARLKVTGKIPEISVYKRSAGALGPRGGFSCKNGTEQRYLSRTDCGIKIASRGWFVRPGIYPGDGCVAGSIAAASTIRFPLVTGTEARDGRRILARRNIRIRRNSNLMPRKSCPVVGDRMAATPARGVGGRLSRLRKLLFDNNIGL